MGSHISCAAILASNVYGYPYTNSDEVTMRDPSPLLVGAASPIPFERMLEHAAILLSRQIRSMFFVKNYRQLG